MRVAALGVAIVALALGGLAIYTFGWRGAGATSSERARAGYELSAGSALITLLRDRADSSPRSSGAR